MIKRNLDELFQEKLKDFTEVPDERVWENIVTSLEKKKKNRMVIPFWWKLGGIAALLAILIYLINPIGGISDEIPIITDIDKVDKPYPLIEKIEKEDALESTGSPEKEGVEDETNSNQQSTVTNSSKNIEEVKIIKKKASDKSKISFDTQNTQVTEKESRKNSRVNNSAIVKMADSNLITEEDALATSEKLTEQSDLDNQENSKKPSIKNNKEIQNIVKDDKGDTYAETNIDKDTAINPERKSLFEEIEEKKKEKIADNEGGKWAVGAELAPVYFNSFGKGSPIHSSFTPNSKTGEINLSYGLSVAYSVSKKMNLRTGINKVDYGYGTNDVEFSSSFNALSADKIANIDYSTNSENLFVSSKTSANALKNDFAFDAASLNSSARDAIMTQQFGYLEVPLEIDYALIDKRFGVNVLGGLSTLFLVDNSVSITSGDLTTEIGKANNLNSVNFSTNVGLGAYYKFTPKVQLKVEPIFKYQLNTFSNTSGTFQPFSLGVYSGIIFKF